VEGDGHKFRPWGLLGGHDGFTADLRVRTREGRETSLPSKVPYTRARPGDTFVAVGPSGGGYGDPLERPAEQVLEDVLDGYISAETALRDYGVVVTEGRIDPAATERTRRQRREVPGGTPA
jgi:N-methylhydantoinase B